MLQHIKLKHIFVKNFLMKKQLTLDLYYTLMCPNCKTLITLLNEVLPGYNDKFQVKKVLASSPFGMVKTMKLGIHTVPTVVINNKVVLKAVPTKEELIQLLNQY